MGCQKPRTQHRDIGARGCRGHQRDWSRPGCRAVALAVVHLAKRLRRPPCRWGPGRGCNGCSRRQCGRSDHQRWRRCVHGCGCRMCCGRSAVPEPQGQGSSEAAPTGRLRVRRAPSGEITCMRASSIRACSSRAASASIHRRRPSSCIRCLRRRQLSSMRRAAYAVPVPLPHWHCHTAH